MTINHTTRVLCGMTRSFQFGTEFKGFFEILGGLFGNNIYIWLRANPISIRPCVYWHFAPPWVSWIVEYRSTNSLTVLELWWINKAPDPDKFQTELIKTMPPEQIRVLQKWLNEILAKGELVTKLTEAEMTGRLVLFHKGGSKSDQISHWSQLFCSTSLTSTSVNYMV